ncbi:hypothetical protein E2C01_046383 [Portunus trituberculatus]|uniref:Uncharacterized protein n=1 Tax=Portunus trituberculatus TaxID=210409 RepID=A0A5B7G0T7_PORTR|nr:hypothetical protein [Portunus trituberculatus]
MDLRRCDGCGGDGGGSDGDGGDGSSIEERGDMFAAPFLSDWFSVWKLSLCVNVATDLETMHIKTSHIASGAANYFVSQLKFRYGALDDISNMI